MSVRIGINPITWTNDDLPELVLYQEEFIWGVRKRVKDFQGRATGDTRVYGCDIA